MAKHKKHSSPRRHESGKSQRGGYALRRLEDRSGWMLVAPRDARQRAEDVEEVAAMLEAGEWEIAEDELRWLLGDCHDFLDAHALLGEIALERQDWALARGHFGYAWELGRAALSAAGVSGLLPYAIAANQPLLNSGKGLAWCLHKQGHHRLALDVLAQLRALDPTDPLGAELLAAEIRRAAESGRGPSLPVVERD
ncbi:MAG: hypothetical protein K1X74_06555 [Pirellulales bacterium]|nr:hypothetical protein [Pirellulales bacterium]